MRKKQSTDAEMTLFGNDGGESTMTITQLCDAVQQLLKSPTVTDKWVVGELIDFSVRNGHCYADLVERMTKGKLWQKFLFECGTINTIVLIKSFMLPQISNSVPGLR